jgi:hypothetical protein
MRKAVLGLIVFAVLAVGAFAQPPQCRVQATAYKPSGVADDRFALTVFRIVLNGTIYSNQRQTFRTNGSGVLLGADGSAGVSLPQGSVSWLYANAPGLDANPNAGTPFQIPNTATGQLTALALATTVLRSQGDLIFGSVDGLPARLPGNTATGGKVLVSRGTGTGSLAPEYWTMEGAGVTADASGKRFIFSGGGGGGGSLLTREVDGAPSITTSILEFDQGDGFLLSDQTGGVARLKLSGIPQSAIANLTSDLAGKSATSHTHAQSDVTNLGSDLALKAALASPALTGTPTAPSLGRGASTGTDQAGNDFSLYAGAGTGTGLSGDLRFQLAGTGASGSTANGLLDRQIITKRKPLTDAAFVNLLTLSLPSLAGASGFLDYTAYATDGTDVQIRRGVVAFSAINKAGVYTSETSIADETLNASAGTLSCSFSFQPGSNQTTLRVNCDTSLTPTTFYLIYQVRNQSEQPITIN